MMDTPNPTPAEFLEPAFTAADVEGPESESDWPPPACLFLLPDPERCDGEQEGGRDRT
jgi:hypothetical protein